MYNLSFKEGGGIWFKKDKWFKATITKLSAHQWNTRPPREKIRSTAALDGKPVLNRSNDLRIEGKEVSKYLRSLQYFVWKKRLSSSSAWEKVGCWLGFGFRDEKKYFGSTGLASIIAPGIAFFLLESLFQLNVSARNQNHFYYYQYRFPKKRHQLAN